MKKILLPFFMLFSFALFGQIIYQNNYDLNSNNIDDDLFILLEDFLKTSINNGSSATNVSAQIKLDSLIREEYSGEWIKLNGVDFTYNENGINDTELQKNWINNQWIIDNQRIDTYDDNNNRVKILFNRWDDINNQIVPNLEYILTYDGHGNILTSTISLWLQNSNDFRFLFLTEYTYDDNNNNLTLKTKKWDSNSETWENHRETYYTYTEGNLIETIIGLFWDSELLQWNETENNKYEHELDSNNNVLTRVRFSIVDEVPIKEDREIFTYNLDNFELSSMMQDWIDEKFWKTRFSKTSNYSDLNNLVQFIYASANFDGEIVSNEKYEFNYDKLVNVNDVLYPFNFQVYNNKLTQILNYFKIEPNDEWIPFQRTTYYYSDQTVNLKEIEHSKMSVYPNPTSGIITFNLGTINHAKLLVFNTLGQAVHEQQLDNTAQVNVAHLNNGLYFYHVVVDETRYGGEFIIKN